MESIYILIPVTFIFLAIAVAIWFWSVGSGQYDDLDKAANSILFDDDAEIPVPTNAQRKKELPTAEGDADEVDDGK